MIAAGAVQAQNYPAKPILAVVPLQAGSAGDVAMRVVTRKMSDNLKQQIAVENQPGAAGLIGAQRVARMAADGYVIGGFSDSVMNYSPALSSKPGFDPVNDFAPVSFVCTIPWVLITHPSLPVKNARELIALAKAAPGKLDYSSAGNGSPHHIVSELFKRAAGIHLNHVPYRGALQSVTDVVAGQIPVAFTGIAVPLPFLKNNKVRALAVPSEKRSTFLPEVSTLAEQGVPGFLFNTWLGMFVPKGTPRPIVERLNAEVVGAVNSADVRERLLSLALEPKSSAPEELGEATRSGLARVSKVIKDAGIKAD